MAKIQSYRAVEDILQFLAADILLSGFDFDFKTKLVNFHLQTIFTRTKVRIVTRKYEIIFYFELTTDSNKTL